MLLTGNLVLAAYDWLGIAVVAVLMVGFSIIRQILEQVRQSQKRPGRQVPIQRPGTDLGSEETAAVRARGSAGISAGRPRAGEPANLTLEQLRERARAKIEYERRAAQLRQQMAVRTSPPSGAGVARPGRPQPVEPGQRIPSSRPSVPVSARPPVRPSIATGMERKPEGVLSRLASEQARAAVRRHVPDTVVVTGPVRRAPVVSCGRRIVPLNMRTLREAVILSELLQPPLALRANWPPF